ncbi:unnamed protein product [Amoebophrya sp. A120]|nr:unnamed protein product [Amoebophrya sp. A120]|eukprot:GSA120T00014897001.1
MLSGASSSSAPSRVLARRTAEVARQPSRSSNYRGSSRSSNYRQHPDENFFSQPANHLRTRRVGSSLRKFSTSVQLPTSSCVSSSSRVFFRMNSQHAARRLLTQSMRGRRAVRYFNTAQSSYGKSITGNVGTGARIFNGARQHHNSHVVRNFLKLTSGGLFLLFLGSNLAAVAAKQSKESELDSLKNLRREVKHVEVPSPSFWALVSRFFSLTWIFLPAVVWAPYCLLFATSHSGKMIADERLDRSDRRDEDEQIAKEHQLASKDQYRHVEQRTNNKLWWFKLLRESLEQAGPVFIKWGQWSSTRYDLFPLELCEELHLLTQKAPAHSPEKTREILERSFGKEIFDVLVLDEGTGNSCNGVSHGACAISTTAGSTAPQASGAAKIPLHPLASGSIGQVYRAQLRNPNDNGKNTRGRSFSKSGWIFSTSTATSADNGAEVQDSRINGSGRDHHNNSCSTTTSQLDKQNLQEVIIKVQHPDLETVMKKDFALLLTFCSFTDSILTKCNLTSFRCTRMMNQFYHHMHDQLDFEKEAANLKIFNKNFNQWPHISFPKPRCATREVLIESFEPGASIYDYIRMKQERNLSMKNNNGGRSKQLVEEQQVEGGVRKISNGDEARTNSTTTKLQAEARSTSVASLINLATSSAEPVDDQLPDFAEHEQDDYCTMGTRCGHEVDHSSTTATHLTSGSTSAGGTTIMSRTSHRQYGAESPSSRSKTSACSLSASTSSSHSGTSSHELPPTGNKAAKAGNNFLHNLFPNLFRATSPFVLAEETSVSVRNFIRRGFELDRTCSDSSSGEKTSSESGKDDESAAHDNENRITRSKRHALDHAISTGGGGAAVVNQGTKVESGFISTPSSTSSPTSGTSRTKAVTTYDQSSEVDSNLVKLDSPSLQKLGSLGLLALLKMIICDNFIHADLHPGNILVRKSSLPPKKHLFSRTKALLYSYVLNVGSYEEVPELVILDAGLSACIEPKKQEFVSAFFQAIATYDGRKLGEAIVALSSLQGGSDGDQAGREDSRGGFDTTRSGAGGGALSSRTSFSTSSSTSSSLFSQNKSDTASALSTSSSFQDKDFGDCFIAEMEEKSKNWQRVRNNPQLYQNCRAGDVIKETLDCCRKHSIELHPTVLIASVSALTLEGWQRELDPSICVMDHIEVILRRQKLFNDLKGEVKFRNLDQIAHGVDYCQLVEGV